jgi:hypothetical protein
MHEIELNGIDGSNLLGYLAAVGTCRVLTLADPDAQVRMRWEERKWWTPVVQHSQIQDPEELIGALAAHLSQANPAYEEDHLDSDLQSFHQKLETAAQSRTRYEADFFTALGSECLAEKKDGKTPATTEFRAVGGGNNEGFLGFMRTLQRETMPEHLKKGLFIEWDYSDPPPFMRWDPNEYRPHALRANDPANDRKRNNVRGANRLAIEALPLFPTVPLSTRLATTGFDMQDHVTWPIWMEPLDLNTIASLLASAEIQKAETFTMSRREIAQVFRATRFTEGRYRNFTPSRAIL